MIKLVRINLVNWYTFSVKTIDLRGSVAIIGPNGAGKSALLDAIQVVITGNNHNYFHLNASSNVLAGRGKSGRSEDARSVLHYCLGKVHGQMLRERGCITYLSLVFEREHDKKCWTVGIGLSTRPEDSREDTLGAFIAPDQSLRAEDFIYEENGVYKTLPYDELVVRLKRTPGFENLGHRPGNFTRRLLKTLKGRHFEAEPNKFMRTLKNALLFREMKSANDFVRNFVLEEAELDIEGLRNSVKTYRGFQEKIEQLEELKDLVVAALGDYRELVEKIEAERRMTWVGRKAERDRTENHLATKRRDVEKRREEERQAVAALARTRDAIDQIKTEIAQIDAALATNDKEIAIKRFREVDLPVAVRAVEETSGTRAHHLATLARGVALIENVKPMAGRDEYRDAYQALQALQARMGDATLIDPGAVDAIVARTLKPLESYIQVITQTRDGYIGELAQLRPTVRELHNQLKSVQSGGSILRRETLNLIDRLDREGIEATPIAELVEVIDERWRNAAETMLGSAREALVIDPTRVKQASDILRAERKDFTGCTIVNTRKTDEVDPRPKGDSLAAVIETDNHHARSYINRRLNGIVRVETTDDLIRVDRGVTPECVSAMGGSIEVRRIDLNPLLGRDARERSAPILQEQIAKSEKLIDRYDGLVKGHDRLISDIRAFLDSACEHKLADLEANLRAANESKLQIEDNIATLESERPVEIRDRLDGLKQDLKGYLNEIGEDERNARAKGGEVLLAQREVHEAEENFAKADAEFSEIDVLSDQERESFMRDLRALMDLYNNTLPAVRNAADKEAGEARARAQKLRGSAPEKAYQYAREADLIKDFDPNRSEQIQLAWLETQLAAIEGNHLSKYRVEAAAARQAMETSLKTDLLLKLHSRIEEGKVQIKDLNNHLKFRPFHGEKYSFEVKPDPAFNDIVEIARQVHEQTIDVASLFDDPATLDPAVARGVDRIKRMIDDGEEISEISDYRKYLRFELVTKAINTDEITSEYAKRQQNGSGGEKQVPFYIAISCAMAATCHHKEKIRENLGLGMVMFDEAFNALDGGNVNSCLTLMREFNLQTIVCAPTEKIGVFMEQMDTIISMGRDGIFCQVDVEYPTEKGRQMFRDSNPANEPLDLFRERFNEGDNLSDAAE